MTKWDQGLTYELLPVPNNNAAICKAGFDSTYGPHQDKQASNSSEMTRPTKLKNGTVLPTRDQMIVVTFCHGIPGSKCNTKVEHYSNNKKAGHPSSQIVTDDNSGHLQLPGTQFGMFYHNSAMLEDGVRLVFSCHTFLDPLTNIEEYANTLAKDGLLPEQLRSQSEEKGTQKKSGRIIYHVYNDTNVMTHAPTTHNIRT